MINKRKIGDLGEAEAAAFLKKSGYKIIEKKYYSRFGEIDIIARDGEYYVFIEVKQRKSAAFGGAAAAISPAKIKRITMTAQLYLQQKSIDGAVRFDVVLIEGCGSQKNIEVIKNAF